jgi:hypothetical protein
MMFPDSILYAMYLVQAAFGRWLDWLVLGSTPWVPASWWVL